MRTTIAFDDATLRQAKQRAHRAGRTLSEWVSDVVRRELSSAAPRQAASPDLPILPAGRGLRPGVDLFDSAALADLLDAHADS